MLGSNRVAVEGPDRCRVDCAEDDVGGDVSHWQFNPWGSRSLGVSDVGLEAEAFKSWRR